MNKFHAKSKMDQFFDEWCSTGIASFQSSRWGYTYCMASGDPKWNSSQSQARHVQIPNWERSEERARCNRNASEIIRFSLIIAPILNAFFRLCCCSGGANRASTDTQPNLWRGWVKVRIHWQILRLYRCGAIYKINNEIWAFSVSDEKWLINLFHFTIPPLVPVAWMMPVLYDVHVSRAQLFLFVLFSLFVCC